MTKDKERDDALIAEAISGFPGNAFTAQMLAQAVLRLERSGWQPAPKPDRWTLAARETKECFLQHWNLEAATKAAAAVLRKHFPERPAVVVPEAVREAAGFNYLEGTYAETLARFIMALDGAKGDE